MSFLESKLGDTLSSIAQQQLGNSSRWRDIADLTGFNPLEAIAPGVGFEIPSSIKSNLSTASTILDCVAGITNNKTAVALSTAAKEINNVFQGDAESILATVASATGLRQYADQGVRLVDWLLK